MLMVKHSIESHEGLAWATLIFFNLPLGIVAVCLSRKIETKCENGDVTGAKALSNAVQILCWIAIGLTLLVLPFLIHALFFSKASHYYTY